MAVAPAAIVDIAVTGGPVDGVGGADVVAGGAGTGGGAGVGPSVGSFILLLFKIFSSIYDRCII